MDMSICHHTDTVLASVVATNWNMAQSHPWTMLPQLLECPIASDWGPNPEKHQPAKDHLKLANVAIAVNQHLPRMCGETTVTLAIPWYVETFHVQNGGGLFLGSPLNSEHPVLLRTRPQNSGLNFGWSIVVFWWTSHIGWHSPGIHQARSESMDHLMMLKSDTRLAADSNHAAARDNPSNIPATKQKMPGHLRSGMFEV